MDGELRFQVMGGLAAWRTQPNGTEVEVDLGGPRPRRLLAALLLSLDQPLPPDRLIELVWGDAAPASARGSLQAYVSNLRRVFEPARRPGARPEVLVLRRGGYQLVIDPSQVDRCTLETAATTGCSELAEGEVATARDRLRTALDGWAPLLPELAEIPFVRAEADRLEARRASAFELLQRARVEIGDHHEAVADLRLGVALDPRAERLWALLALARYRSGHPADAIATVQAARAALGDAGLALGPELRQLEADLYAHSDALSVSGGSADRAERRVPISARSGAHRRCRPVGARRHGPTGGTAVHHR